MARKSERNRPGSGIFVSYRRGETGAITGRIADRLSQHFGEANVFMDIEAIQPGADFVKRIEEAVGACRALVVVIGPDWGTEQDASGRRRLDDPNDFVALEVAAGLERDVLLIPVLVGGAVMPSADQLPARLAGLSRRNALQISDLRFRDDIGHLIDTIDAVVPASAAGATPPPTRSRRRRVVLALVVLGVLAVGAAAVAIAGGGSSTGGKPPRISAGTNLGANPGSTNATAPGSTNGGSAGPPAATAGPPAATAQIAPGSYSGGLVGYSSSPLAFYVSPDGKQVQDVSFGLSFGCTPGGTLDDTLDIAEGPIAPDGSFTATAHQTGIYDGGPAKYTYTFSGQFHGQTVAGRVRDDVAYNNGTTYSCTSSTESWSATRDDQGTQTQSPLPAGSYSGGLVGYSASPLAFYVSSDSKQLQNVTFALTPTCAPSNTLDNTVSMPAIPIAADGSFTRTTTQNTVVNGSMAKITSTFTGHFHGFDTSGVARMAGQVRDDVTYKDGTDVCTTGDLAWSATKQ